MTSEPAIAYDYFLDINELDAELASRHLHDFIRVGWSVLHPVTPFVDGWHIGAICEHTEAFIAGEIKKLFIALPPRSLKSECISVFAPAWSWIKRPDLSWIFTGYNEDLTSEHSVACRRIIESQWYRIFWGNKFRLTSDQNEKMHFDNDKSGSRSAFGFSGTTGHGGDLNVVDDPHDRRDWSNPTKLKKRCEEYDANVYPAVNDFTKSGRMIVGQRLSQLDLIGHVEKQGDWHSLVIPAEYDPKRSKVTVIGWKDPRKKQGELVSPQRFGRKEANTEKRKRRIWSAQYQQAPTADTATMFKRHDWRYYTEGPHEIAKRDGALVILSGDLSFKDLQTSSLVALHIWCLIGPNKYLLDRIGDHLDFNETVRRILALNEAWPEISARVIEEKANGAAVINHLKAKLSALIPWPPVGAKAMESKESRAVAMQPDHEGGNIWLPQAAKYPWVDEVVEYFADFPNGEYDDDIDAASQAHAYFERFAGIGWRPL